MEGSYLDLAVLINGLMDAFLLVLSGGMLKRSLKWQGILGGVVLGEIPVVLSFFTDSTLLTFSKVVTPLFMVWIAFRPPNIKTYLKVSFVFWLLSAGLGGLVYALWGWAQFAGPEGKPFALALTNIWLLPLTVWAWWLAQKFWHRWQSRVSVLQESLYDLEIDFGVQDKPTLHVKAFLDTGNELCDPLTGMPIIFLEEQAATSAMPESVLSFLKLPWHESDNPWPFLWNSDPALMKYMVFIPFKTVERQSWLLGVRPQRIICYSGGEGKTIKATIALVKQILNSDGEYQALLHPEHVHMLKGGDECP